MSKDELYRKLMGTKEGTWRVDVGTRRECKLWEDIPKCSHFGWAGKKKTAHACRNKSRAVVMVSFLQPESRGLFEKTIKWNINYWMFLVSSLVLSWIAFIPSCKRVNKRETTGGGRDDGYRNERWRSKERKKGKKKRKGGGKGGMKRGQDRMGEGGVRPLPRPKGRRFR